MPRPRLCDILPGVSDPSIPKGSPAATAPGNVGRPAASSGAVPVAARIGPPPLPRPNEEELEEIEEFEVLDAEPIPSKLPPPLPDAVPRPSSTHADPDAKVVLVVEDDPSIRTILVRALGITYTIYEAEDGMTAVEILGKLAPPACIVSDWNMPRIMLTAKNHPLEVVQGINAGARHYLAKPFKMKELIEKVAHVLGAPRLTPRR